MCFAPQTDEVMRNGLSLISNVNACYNHRILPIMNRENPVERTLGMKICHSGRGRRALLMNKNEGKSTAQLLERASCGDRGGVSSLLQYSASQHSHTRWTICLPSYAFVYPNCLVAIGLGGSFL